MPYREAPPLPVPLAPLPWYIRALHWWWAKRRAWDRWRGFEPSPIEGSEGTAYYATDSLGKTVLMYRYEQLPAHWRAAIDPPQRGWHSDYP